MDFDKSRVYSALNADELTPGTRVLTGNTIDLLRQKVNAYDREDENHEATEPATLERILGETEAKRFEVRHDEIDHTDTYAFVYVIPCTARPFNDLKELIQHWDRHYQSHKRPWYTLPFIWVVSSRGTHLLITGFRKEDNTVEIGKEWHSLQYMFDNFTFEDGRPFGVMIR